MMRAFKITFFNGFVMEYPSVEKLVELNLLALVVIRAKKADQPKVLSKAKLVAVLSECEKKEGDVFEKASCLLSGLVKAHAFASGNRRTAFLAMKYFLVINNAYPKVSDDPSNSKVMLGIREGYYSSDEIKEWIKYGKIREFKR